MKGTQGLFALSNCCKTRSEDDIICMPRVYSQDLRWKAIWLTEILGFEIDGVSLLL